MQVARIVCSVDSHVTVCRCPDTFALSRTTYGNLDYITKKLILKKEENLKTQGLILGL